MRPGVGSAVFVGVMLAASLTTMVRVIVVAWFLPTAEFAAYASIVATGAFLATLISFGAVEATIKAFPRLVADGRQDELLGRAHQILRRVAARAAVAGIPLFIAGEWLQLEWLRLSGIAFLVALTTSYTAILASMQRAAGNPVSLASGTVLRTAGVLAAVALAAIFGDLTTVIAAETIATALTCFLSERLYFSKRTRAHSNADPAEAPPLRTAIGWDGIHLFLAYTLVAIPFYLDRIYVTGVMGTAEGAQYAILALFLTAASLLVNAVAQRVGPDAIKLAHSGEGSAAARQVALWCGIVGIVWLGAMTAAGIVVAADILPPALARYGLGVDFLMPIALSGLLLNTALLEFLLIAFDRERQFLRAAIFFSATVIVAALAVAFARWGLLELMWLLAACRAAYASALLLALPLHGNPNRSRADEREPPTSGSNGLFCAGFPGR